jgi:hypothetical protein
MEWEAVSTRTGVRYQTFTVQNRCHRLKRRSVFAQQRPHFGRLFSGAEWGRGVALQILLITLTISVTLGASVSSASAWWQFAANSPTGARQTSPHYDTLKECERALKVAESKLAKKYPDLYPLVGSCEEYR